MLGRFRKQFPTLKGFTGFTGFTKHMTAADSCRQLQTAADPRKASARREASSSFEYHLAVHCPQISSCSTWQLVKLPKVANVKELHQATCAALGKDVETFQDFNFYPVERKTVDGACVKLGPQLKEIGCLDLLLVALPPDHLQVVQLIFAPEVPQPAEVPQGPKAFNVCGMCLPLVGTSHQFKGPYAIPEYNFAQNVFPPTGKYPYGSTVRSYDGRKQDVWEFGTTVFHEDTQYTETMTADANIVQELIARTSDFPKLWNRDVEVGLQAGHPRSPTITPRLPHDPRSNSCYLKTW